RAFAAPQGKRQRAENPRSSSPPARRTSQCEAPIRSLGGYSMKRNSADRIGALKDNFEMWKVVLPVLLSILIVGTVAGFAIDLALGNPITFVAWSITCLVAGAGAYRLWLKPKPETPSDWSCSYHRDSLTTRSSVGAVRRHRCARAGTMMRS